MSWTSKSYLGPAEGYTFELQSPPNRDQLDPRQQGITDKVAEILPGLVNTFGGENVAVSAYGHSAAEKPAIGDTLSISITHITPHPELR